MSTALFGFLSGIGSAQRQFNQQDYETKINAERTANEGTVKMLESLLGRDDLPVETKNAAAQSLLNFSKVPGLATAKHRAQAMEPVLSSFNTPRTFVSPNVQQTRDQGTQLEHAGQQQSDMSSAFTDQGDFPFAPVPGAPSMSEVGGGMSRFAKYAMGRGHEMASTPGETRTGFMKGDELGAARGRSLGTQTRAMYDAMGDVPGVNSPSSSGMSIVMLPNGKGGVSPHVINPSVTPSQARYIDADGNETEGFINYDHRNGRATDGFGNPVQPIALMTRDGYMTMSGVDQSGAPVKQVGMKSDFAAGSPAKQFVRKVPVRGETVTGDQTLTSFDPVSGTVAGGSPRVIGQKTNSDVSRGRIVTSTESTRAGTEIKKGTYKATIDPNAFPEVAAPAGLPTLSDENGEPVTVGTRMYTATKEPGSVLQRASAARSTSTQATKVAKMVEDPKNADIFGKASGRWNELLVDGPQAFGLKWIGPIGTNDTRLTELHAAVKSISDLLTTVHGRRAEEAAQGFARTLKMVNSPAALAAAIRQYGQIVEEIASEGPRPTTKLDLSRGRVPTRTPSPSPSSGGRPNIGDVVLVDGKKHRVTGFNPKTNKPIVDPTPIP